MFSQNILDSQQVMLSNTIRRLWFEHILWTRFFIISTAEELGDLEFVTQRLLKNPSDFGEVLGKFYDKSVADRFIKLFTDHLLIAADLVNAAKAGDSKSAEMARIRWYDNADDIAGFFAKINPFWSERQWQQMLYEHLELTEEEAAQRLAGNYQRDIELFDDIEEQALHMADVMTRGLLRQFQM
ncbi:MAG: acetylglutamate kinase [Clostridia bacterium]|nr:acetylglutamate kinase [Clostridia bacterium]